MRVWWFGPAGGRARVSEVVFGLARTFCCSSGLGAWWVWLGAWWVWLGAGVGGVGVGWLAGG